MDVKDDIFSNIPHFLEEIKQQESLNSVRAQAAALSPVSHCSSHWRLTQWLTLHFSSYTVLHSQ